MAATLSPVEVQDLQAALRVLVAPLEYPDLVSWCAAATERCRVFLKADQALFGLMSSDRMVVFPQGAYAGDAADSYMRHYWRHDFVLTERRFQLRRETYHRDMLYQPGERERCVVYNEWSRPNRFCDTMGMSVEASNPMLAGIHFYHDTETGVFRDRGVELLDLLLPAFRAGVYTWLTLGKRRSAIDALLEANSDGVMLATLSGETVHQTPGLERTLRDDPEATRIRRAMIDAATALGAMVQRARKWTVDRQHPAESLVREMKTARAHYRLVASYVPEGTIASHPAVAVVLTRQGSRTLSDDELRRKFGLTARQVDVARRLAQGMRNDAIASALGISKATALRHTEVVLRKLGVHSRAAVASVLTGG